MQPHKKRRKKKNLSEVQLQDVFLHVQHLFCSSGPDVILRKSKWDLFRLGDVKIKEGRRGGWKGGGDFSRKKSESFKVCEFKTFLIFLDVQAIKALEASAHTAHATQVKGVGSINLMIVSASELLLFRAPLGGEVHSALDFRRKKAH